MDAAKKDDSLFIRVLNRCLGHRPAKKAPTDSKKRTPSKEYLEVQAELAKLEAATEKMKGIHIWDAKMEAMFQKIHASNGWEMPIPRKVDG